MVDNGIPRPAPLNTVRRVPNTVRHAASSSSLSAQIPISAGQVVGLAREAMKNALDEHEKKAALAAKAEGLTVPGVTIDLSHKQIQRFPEEVVDIIKKELERLALSHNLISTFPARFAECTSLRYLNVRNNAIREFPESICELKSLEILDLGRNKLKVLPASLANLTSLKVLSVQKNRIEVLPPCIADMTSLQILKLEGNPLRFPPKELLVFQTQTSPNGGSQENEVDDMAVTAQVKRFLKQKAVNDRSETESGGEESSEGTETPRPVKRVMSGRFPIKVNGTEVPDLRSPAFTPRPPPIPSRSHYRGLSQQNAALRRPGVMPLTIGSANERVRSNSEGLLPATRDPRDRSAERSRRMGIVSKKAQELGTVDEMKANNRYSHYRGLSHGSAMQVGTNGNTRSPASPADSVLQRAAYIKRLSSLPERKRESLSVDPVVESAKSILYALFQVHPLIQNLLGVTRDGTNKRTSLERVFYNATTHVEELDRHIQEYDTYTEEDEEASPRSNENVHRTCVTCVSAYIHVCSLLQRNVQALLDNGDPRYIRSLLLNVYGSIAEIRNASEAISRARQGEKSFGVADDMENAERAQQTDGKARATDEMEGAQRFGPDGRPRVSKEDYESVRVAMERAALDETMRAQPRDKSATPTRERPGATPRLRSTTVVRDSNLRVATDQPPPPFMNAAARSATFTSATPRSGESFASSASSARMMGGDFTEEDRIFEKIFLGLQSNIEMAIKALPPCNVSFRASLKANSQSALPDVTNESWHYIISRCNITFQAAETLKARLSQIKLKEPGVRTQATFWILCNNFIRAFIDLVMEVKKAKATTPLLNVQVIMLLRPLQKAIKATSQLIHESPWAFLASDNKNGGNGSYITQSPASQVPLPMTPQSAALGPAVQATVPSTPNSATNMSMFPGAPSERARELFPTTFALIASQAARKAARDSMSGTSLFSPNDGFMTPANTQPMSFLRPRSNGNGNNTGNDGSNGGIGGNVGKGKSSF
ncbi:hypothetical protein EG329_012256 [Mollisiaceae sp. DMI_Dod_QoI]|nr:hypothetical protein EG329_012256 [Helotiales sp. DMI_Dod_QoI]